MQKYISVILLLLLFNSCKNSNKNLIDVSHVKVDYTLDRFDIEFYTATTDNLKNVQQKFELFMPNNVNDSVWINKIKNKDEKELFLETQKVYNNISFLESQLTHLFKYLKYYFPKFISPKVITLQSNIDYPNRVIYTEDYLLISLDLYLGETHDFYADFPKYIKQNLTKDHIIIDVTNAIITKLYKRVDDRSFVSKMVNEGVKLYLLNAFLPDGKSADKLGYSEQKYKWAIDNEELIWKYFIENKLLFSTDTKLNKRFLEVAPFSKFYRSEDNLSPGMIGGWIGLQIVNSYMQHNDVSLQELMQKKTEEIYKKSKYKPKK